MKDFISVIALVFVILLCLNSIQVWSQVDRIEANQRRIESKLDMLLTPEGPPPPCFDTAPFTIP